jgi:hypothetical protein
MLRLPLGAALLPIPRIPGRAIAALSVLGEDVGGIAVQPTLPGLGRRITG